MFSYAVLDAIWMESMLMHRIPSPINMLFLPTTAPDGPQTAPEVMTPFERQDGMFGENEGTTPLTVVLV